MLPCHAIIAVAIGPASGQPLLSSYSYYGDHTRLGMARLGLGVRLGLGLAVAAVALAWLGFVPGEWNMDDSLTTRVRILHCAY